jgi:mono/diheme cytochrome c family protein
MGSMLGGLTPKSSLKSRRAMLDTLLRHLPMVRLSLGALAALTIMGCSGLIDDGGDDTSVTPEEKAARELYVSKAKPVFDVACANCHSGSDPTVAFIAGADPMAQRATLLGYDPQVVNLSAATSSRILTKGAHSGPALLASQASDLLEWIQAERDAANVTGGVDPGLVTEAFTPQICTGGNPGDATCPINIVPLDSLVQAWGGARIKFVAQALSQDLYVTNLALEGGADGVYIEHPLFVSWPITEGAQPIPDQLDRFFNVKMNLKMGDPASPIQGGTAAFINFNPANKLTINFKVVDKYKPEDGGMMGGTAAAGCKQLASFKTNAKGPLQTNCASCHANAGNTNARGAMDITGIAATDDATLQNVCNQARTRINFTDTNQSGFFIAPNPAQATNHPFKFPAQANFDAFKTAVDVWVQAEKTSQ